MSWEVPDVKSRISFFNWGVARHFLRRFWPLWTSYFIALLLLLPGQLTNELHHAYTELESAVDYAAVNSGILLVYISMGVGVLTAMAMFHYLYQTRSCGTMNALPIRRETMFATAFLTGLVPLLLSDILTMLLTAAIYCPGGMLQFSTLLDWLALVLMGNTAFYGFAVFCAVLTGNLLILPAVYAVLNFAVAVAESCVREVLSVFVYGMPSGGLKLVFLSPPVKLYRCLNVSYVYEWVGDERWIVPGAYELSGLKTLAAYCAAGLLLSLAALLLYRRRQMETATDVVAVPVLRPVFQYCMAFGGAAVFADLVQGWLFRYAATGLSLAALMLALMFAGAFIGYFLAEMLMQKTLHVFHGKWRGYLIVCAVLLVFTAVFEFDAFGYERTVPDAADVASVRLVGYGVSFEGEQGIEETIRFHQELIDRKSENESKQDVRWLTLVYSLRDGSEYKRVYPIPFAESDLEDSLMRHLQTLCDLPEGVMKRTTTATPVERENVLYAELYIAVPQENGVVNYREVNLTPEQAISLYREGILPDAELGNIGHSWLIEDESYYEQVYGASISIGLRDRETLRLGSANFYDDLYLQVETGSVNTLRWLKENVDPELYTLKELGFDEQVYAVTHSVG